MYTLLAKGLGLLLLVSAIFAGGYHYASTRFEPEIEGLKLQVKDTQAANAEMATQMKVQNESVAKYQAAEVQAAQKGQAAVSQTVASQAARRQKIRTLRSKIQAPDQKGLTCKDALGVIRGQL